MVTDRYQHLRHHPTAGDLAAFAHGQGLTLLGIDNLPGSQPLETTVLPHDVCLLFGQEGPGLSDAAREACDGTLSIAQFGSTRSINASAAAAIAMHTWVRTHADLGDHDAGPGPGLWRG
jgi:tRNA G18 (ribose-2'-O)-methylase SpoU